MNVCTKYHSNDPQTDSLERPLGDPSYHGVALES